MPKSRIKSIKKSFRLNGFRSLPPREHGPNGCYGPVTSTKNPSYPDVKYVEALIGPDTINTLPMETLNAYRDHGDPATRLELDVDKARQVLKNLAELGINLQEKTQQLEDEGIEKFVKPFNKLEKTLEEKRKEALAEPVDAQELHLGQHKAQVESRISKMESFPVRQPLVAQGRQSVEGRP